MDREQIEYLISDSDLWNTPLIPEALESLTAEIERLNADLEIATGALEYITERNYTGAATVAHEALAKIAAGD